MKDSQHNAVPLGISITEVARLTGFSRELILREYHRGNLPGVKLGRKIMISRAAVDRMVAEGLSGLPSKAVTATSNS